MIQSQQTLPCSRSILTLLPIVFFSPQKESFNLRISKERLSRRSYIFLAAIKTTFPTFLLFFFSLSFRTDIPLTFYELNCISLHEALADNLRAFYSEVFFSFQAMIYIASSQSQASAVGLAEILQGKGVRHQLKQVFEDPSVAY